MIEMLLLVAIVIVGCILCNRISDKIGVPMLLAFILLGIIGINMIRESREKEEELNGSFGFKTMIPMAVATSIDALAVGVSFAFMRVEIGWAVVLIGAITFTLSAIGVKIGNHFGAKYKSKAELFGGIVLILLGTKILLEHLGIL